jgi:hypothetical protein
MKLPLIFLLILSISFISAWPLSFVNGTITDLGTNETINGTAVDFVLANDTLFIIPKINITQNITYVNNTYVNNTYLNSTGNYTIENITNVTYQNNTCINCTYNQTGIFYNMSQIDDKFALKSDIKTYDLSPYASKSELSAYALKAVNNTISEKSYVENTTFWIIAGVLLAISIIIAAIMFTRD